MPPAPPTFSTTTVWPSNSPMRCATMRPMVSCGPPAANGMTMVTGRVGKSWAPAGAANASAAKAAANSAFFIVVLQMRKALRGGRPPVKRGRQAWLTDLEDVLGELVQPVARAVAADEVVVAEPVEIARVDIRRMDDDIHVLFNDHGFIVAHKRPLHQVVALAVTIKPRLGRPAVFTHEIVEGVPDILAGSAWLEQIERELARGLAELELVLHRLRHFGADDAGAAKLRVHAARTIVLHEKRDL